MGCCEKFPEGKRQDASGSSTKVTRFGPILGPPSTEAIDRLFGYGTRDGSSANFRPSHQNVRLCCQRNLVQYVLDHGFRHRGFTVTSSTPQVTIRGSTNSFPNYNPCVIVHFAYIRIKFAIFYCDLPLTKR